VTDTGIPTAIADALAESPLVLCDVGARGGPPPQWRPFFACLHWVAVEPDARSRDAFDPATLPRRHTILPTALWSRPGRVPFHLTRDEGDSSVLTPNTPFLRQFARPERFDVVETTEIEAITLDEALRGAGIPAVDFIKLDTQGSELHILEGGNRTLAAGVLGVDIEVEFNRLYQDQPLFADVDPIVRRAGLELVDLAPKRWPFASGEALHLARGAVVWGEALYLRAADALQSDVAAIAAPQERLARVAKGIAIGLMYGIPDYAAAVAVACGPLLPSGAEGSMRAAVEQWDASGPASPMTFQVDLKPDDLRALRRLESRLGKKPTAQVRKAIREWIRGQEDASDKARERSRG
jgi:FkbM family methyltransferase